MSLVFTNKDILVIMSVRIALHSTLPLTADVTKEILPDDFRDWSWSSASCPFPGRCRVFDVILDKPERSTGTKLQPSELQTGSGPLSVNWMVVVYIQLEDVFANALAMI